MYISVYNVLFLIVIMVQFSHSTFTGDEASGVLRVTLSLVGGTSAVNFTVTVIPSDQSPPSAKGERCARCIVYIISVN